MLSQFKKCSECKKVSYKVINTIVLSKGKKTKKDICISCYELLLK